MTMICFCYHDNHFRTEEKNLKQRKPFLCLNAVILGKNIYQYKKQHGLLDASSEEFLSVYQSSAKSSLLFLLSS